MRKETSRKLLTTLLTLISLCTFSCSNMINDMKAMSELKKPAPEPKTFNEIWIEKINTEDYELSASVPETGFYLAEEKSETDEKGNTFNSSWYKRNRIKIGFDPDGGFWPMKSSDGTDASGDIKWDVHKYGEEIRVPSVKRTPTDDDPTEWLIFKTGYGFSGWEKTVIGENTYELTPLAICPALENESELVFKAKWIPDTDTQYKVIYLLQKADNDEYEELSDSFMGTTGEMTDVSAPAIPGYIQTGTIQNEIIEGDGSTEISITYNRKIVKLTFKTGSSRVKWDDNTNEDITVSGKYGAAVNSQAVKNPVHEDSNFKFSGWNTEGGEIPSVFPLEDSEFTSVWANPYKDYKVTHYFQNTNLDGYTINETFTTTKTGTIGNYTNAIPVETEGFSAVSFNQKLLTDDQEPNDIEIYYNRSTVKISLNPDSGKWKDGSNEIKEISAVYGAGITSYPELGDREGFKFTGWVNSSGQSVALPSTGPSQNLFLTATWERTIANYTILHWFQKTTLGTNKATDYDADDSKNKYPSGTIGQNTNVTADDFSGFIPPDSSSIEIKTIASDNSTVINLYYDRKPVTVKLNSAGGKWSDNTTNEKKIDTYFGLSLPYPSNPKMSGYSLTGWKINNSETVLTTLPAEAGSENVTYTAIWDVANADYSVIHYFQNTSLDGYAEENATTETFSGTVYAYTTAAAKTVTGFTPKPFSQVQISESGTTVKIYYDRNQAKLTLDAAGGKWSDGTSTSKEINTHYGVSISASEIPENPTREHYSFAGWKYTVNDNEQNVSELPSSGLPADRTYTARWTQTEALYKVRYLFEKTDGSGYEQISLYPDTEHYGTLNTITNVSAPDITGFDVESINNKTISLETATVDVKYSRKEYTVSFDPNGGYWKENNKTTSVSIKQKYDSSYSVPAAASVERLDFTFKGWKTDDGVTPDGTIPAADTVYKAQWDYGGSRYYVVHKFQSLTNPSDYETLAEYPEEEKGGILMGTTSAEAKNVPGFTAQPISQMTISAGGLTKVSVLYDRNDITLTFKANGGKFSDGTLVTSRTGKYGASTDGLIPANPSIEDPLKTFGGWTESGGAGAITLPSTFPSSGLTYEAVWNDIPAGTINGTGTYTNKDLTVTYTFGSDTLNFTVTHELSDLELTYLEINLESISVSGINVAKTNVSGKTQYTFSVPFTKGAGKYGLTLEMSNNKLTYTLPNKVMTKN